MRFSRKNSDQINIGSLRDQGARISHHQGFLFWLNKVSFVLCTAASIFIVLMTIKVGMHLMKVPNLTFLDKYNPIETIQVYDKNDKLIVSVDGSEKRILVPLSGVSPNMRKALLAAEDHHFYEHKGVSIVGIFRAVASNLTHGKVVEGGSTITQQLAKNLFFEGEKRTFDLKLAELIIALTLENLYQKDKILELYLNEVYFGNNSYGIEQASRNYFGKKASQLTMAESAFLAGIIRYPTKGGSAENRLSATIREREVLDKMCAYGFINEMDRDMAKQEYLNFKTAAPEPPKVKINKYPYYVAAVIENIHGRYNEASIERQGIKIFTNLDTIAQDAAERALSRGLARAPYGVNQGALVSIRVTDGAVIALVGGVGNYEQNQWNCATNPHTAGSAFKPFVYLAGFENGLINENSVVDDTPFAIADNRGKEYKPKNYDGKFLGEISVPKAFALSRNIPALRIGQAVGVESVINVAQRAGITEPLAPELALSLGCSAVSPLHLANAYATFARGGTYLTPLMVRRVETRTGRILDSFGQSSNTAFDHAAVAQLVDCMEDCVAEGTAQLAKLSDRPVAGKTGTADHGKDLWFVGFTPDICTAVWGGNKDNKPVGASVTGGTIMTRIWRDYMSSYYRQVSTPAGWFVACNRPAAQFAPDRGPIEEKPKTAIAGPSHSSYTRSYATYSSRPAAPRRRRRQATRYDYARAPAGGAIVKQGHGTTEYAWSRR